MDENERKTFEALAKKQSSFEEAVGTEHFVVAKIAMDGMKHVFVQAAKGDKSCQIYCEQLLEAMRQYELSKRILVVGDGARSH